MQNNVGFLCSTSGCHGAVTEKILRALPAQRQLREGGSALGRLAAVRKKRNLRHGWGQARACHMVTRHPSFVLRPPHRRRRNAAQRSSGASPARGIPVTVSTTHGPSVLASPHARPGPPSDSETSPSVSSRREASRGGALPPATPIICIGGSVVRGPPPGSAVR